MNKKSREISLALENVNYSLLTAQHSVLILQYFNSQIVLWTTQQCYQFYSDWKTLSSLRSHIAVTQREHTLFVLIFIFGEWQWQWDMKKTIFFLPNILDFVVRVRLSVVQNRYKIFLLIQRVTSKLILLIFISSLLSTCPIK